MRSRRTAIALLVVFMNSILLGISHPIGVAATGIPDPRFGIVQAHEAPAAATALGAGWTRVTFRWNEIQSQSPDEWNVVPISDQALASELAQGRQVVGLLVTTPGWATDTSIGPGVPKGLYLPVDDPNNLWASFVRRIVSRYTGRIDHWIIWNEPDIPTTQHMSWRGSVTDFVQLLQVAYTVAKETNPNAVVHMSAVTHWWNEHWFGHFLEALVATPHAAANDYYFDAATLHIYFQPETVYDITAHYVSMMRGHGIQKPIWIAETNAAPSHDPAWPVPNAQFDVSLEEQAYYIVQALSLGIAAGAGHIAVYKMADIETDRAANPEPFGLVREDGSRRPAFTAYRVAMTYLAGFRSGTWDRRDDISVVTVDRGGTTTTVAWSRTPESQIAMIAARTTQALLVDVWGSAQYVYPERGYYFIDLPGARCAQGCMIGGAPYMLIEEAPASAKTAPTPRPLTPTPVETSSPDTASDHTPTPSSMPTLTPKPKGTPTLIATPTVTATSTSTLAPTGTATPSSMPTGTPTSTSTPTLTPTHTSTAPPLPTRTHVPRRTSTSTPSPTPSPTPIPAPTSDIPPRRPWFLIGVLALAMAGGALAVDLGSQPRLSRQADPRPSAHGVRSIRTSGRRRGMPAYVSGTLILTMLMATIVLVWRILLP